MKCYNIYNNFLLYMYWQIQTSVTVIFLYTEHPANLQAIKQVPDGPVNVNTSITLICSISGGMPKPKLTWNCSGLVNNTNTNDSTISAISIIASKYHNQQMCSCSAFHLIESFRPEVHHKLTVLCKKLMIINTLHFTHKLSVICKYKKCISINSNSNIKLRHLYILTNI